MKGVSKILFQSLKYEHRFVSASLLARPVEMAEWTGLEPATPGVTGSHQKPISMRVTDRFVISKFGDLKVFFRGKRIAYFKVIDS